MKLFLNGLFLCATFPLISQDRPLADILNVEETPSVQNHYWYFSGGVAVLSPKVSVGYRYQKGVLGGDISLTVAAIPPLFSSQGLQFNQLFYPKPNLNKEWYVGLSGGCHSFLGEYPIGAGLDFSAGLVAGYEFKSKDSYHFIEGKLGFPIRTSKAARHPVPVPSIAYGVSF